MPELSTNSSIEECLAAFKDATFGEDVRDALIAAINLCYRDIVKAVWQMKKGDSITNATIQDGHLILTITDNETQESRPIDAGVVKGDKGDQGPKGDPGDTGKEGTIIVDGSLDATSPRAIANSAVTVALNNKVSKSNSTSNQYVARYDSDGNIVPSTVKIGSAMGFNDTDDGNRLARERAVKKYAYSKLEADNRFIQEHQDLSDYALSENVYSKDDANEKFFSADNIDTALSTESENPVQNKTIATKIAEIENNYSAPEAALDITSTNAVQNKVIAEALNSKVNVSDFNNTIFDDIDMAFSNTNGGIYYNGECPSAPALFIEAESGVSEYPSGYAYYLSYVDSLYDSDDNPHWHRIANISNLITRVIPVDNDFYDLSKNPVQSKVIKAALDKKMEYADESYGPQSLDDINHFTDPNKIYHFYLGLNNINEMVDLIFIVNDDEADWDNEIYPYSCQFMLSQSGKIYYRKTDDQGLFGNVHDYMENYYTKSEIDAMLNSQ